MFKFSKSKSKPKRMTGYDWQAAHGFLGNKDWPMPKIASFYDQPNRPDQGNTIHCHEYLDEPEVIRAKVKLVGDLLRQSKHTTAYTGAGISVASGVPDYASKGDSSLVKVEKKGSPLQALPTFAHFSLTHLFHEGLLHSWMQQNHDGLPEKAGMPTEVLNSIHGDWFDPSNPVVPFDGNLRGDYFEQMLDIERATDLCLCLGTSLSGMNADRTAETPAKKSLRGKALGTVIVNLQATRLDGKSAVRIWAKLDDLFKMVMEELGFSKIPTQCAPVPKEDIFQLPYNQHGKFDQSCTMVLDLSKGAQLKICAREAPNYGALGQVDGRSREGNWVVTINEILKRGCLEHKVFVRRHLGRWWIDAAQRGALPQLPLINTKPVVKKQHCTLKKLSCVQEQRSSTSANSASSSSSSSSTTTTTTGHNQPQASSSSTTPKSLPPKLVLVQSHKVVGQSGENTTHEWELRLDNASAPYVKTVSYQLHPTFQPSKITLSDQRAGFSLKRTGWGTFPVNISLKLIDGRELHGVHSLSFKKEGQTVKSTKIKVV